MKSLILGASAGLGRALAERLALDGHTLYLVASDARDLDALSRDLELRCGASVFYRAADLAQIDPEGLRDEVLGAMGSLDNLFYVAGFSSSDDSGPSEDALLQNIMAVNFTSAIRIINAFLEALIESPQGNCVGIGSIAAARGRGRNSVYAASKRGFETYFECLRHFLAPTRCSVQFYRFGYITTRMTFGQNLPLPAIKAGGAADSIVRRLDTDTGTLHVPAWWAPITILLQFLPWGIYKRLNF